MDNGDYLYMLRYHVRVLLRISKCQKLLYLPLVLICLAGCYRDVLVRPESLEKDATEDLVITLRDARKIKLSSGEYKCVIDSTGQFAVVGTEKVYRSGGGQFESFNGLLRQHEIEKITASELGPGFYITIAALGVTTALVVWAILHFPSGHQ